MPDPVAPVRAPGRVYALGVDIGTTYTAAAVWHAGRAETVGLGNRSQTVPTVVYLDEAGGHVVGEAADRRSATTPDRVAREFKRRFGDEIPLLLGGEEVGAQELTASVLRWVLDTVTGRQGAPPAHVTLTVPATWRDVRRDLLLEAALRAGLDRSRCAVLPEPAAAAIYYAGQHPLEPGTAVGVYDLGGGTFDATVLRKTPRSLEVIGQPVGADHIGGVDVDHALLRRVVAAIGPAWHELDAGSPAVRSGLAALRAAVVDAKEALSAETSTIVPVVLPGLVREVTVTREELERSIHGSVVETVDVFRRAVELAGLTMPDLAAVLLVGGASRMPLVRTLVQEHLDVPVHIDAHPKFAVCLGAAVSAGAALPAPPAQRQAPPAHTGTPVAARPEQREQPDPPEQPEQPDPPEQPEQREQPEQPEQPEQREQPEQPEQPEQREQPERPEQPEQPAPDRRPQDPVAPPRQDQGAVDTVTTSPPTPPGQQAGSPRALRPTLQWRVGPRTGEDAPAAIWVDLARTGLSGAGEVPLSPAVPPARRTALPDQDAPVVVDLGADTDYAPTARGPALMVAGILGLVVLALGLVTALSR